MENINEKRWMYEGASQKQLEEDIMKCKDDEFVILLYDGFKLIYNKLDGIYQLGDPCGWWRDIAPYYAGRFDEMLYTLDHLEKDLVLIDAPVEWIDNIINLINGSEIDTYDPNKDPYC